MSWPLSRDHGRDADRLLSGNWGKDGSARAVSQAPSLTESRSGLLSSRFGYVEE
jgi:hypothetical protein